MGFQRISRTKPSVDHMSEESAQMFLSCQNTRFRYQFSLPPSSPRLRVYAGTLQGWRSLDHAIKTLLKLEDSSHNTSSSSGPISPTMPAATASASTYVEAYTTQYENKSAPNDDGVNPIPTYPDLLHGTNCEQPIISDYKPPSEVDVLIVGAGPVGLTIAASFVRQGISFRILDQSPHPLVVGRADALQPRTMEAIHQLGLSEELFSLGPRIEHTVVYKDGKKMIFKETHNDPGVSGRFQGLHVLTQTETEHALIRDLVRHDVLVERPCTAKNYELSEDSSLTHPVTVNVINHATKAEEVVKARFLVGSDGAHSMIRKSIPDIKFDGVKTDLHWGIVDAVFKTDFPHRWIFGCVINSDAGGCMIIPRERDMVRLYAQLRPEPGQEWDPSKWGPNEVLAQLNKIFAPYTLEYEGAIDWFTVLTINERVASTFTYKDRIFLSGDSCHVHSAKGAMGMNTGIMDAQNLSWKLSMLVKGVAGPRIMDTYDVERRENALRAVALSARYLRFVSNCTFESLDDAKSLELDQDKYAPLPGEDAHVAFFRQFAIDNERFLIGLDVDYRDSQINKKVDPSLKNIRAGYRAPDPRVSLSLGRAGRLYDAFGGIDQFKIVLFGSNLKGPISNKLHAVDAYLASQKSFLKTYSIADIFKVVVVARDLPKAADAAFKEYPFLSKNAQLVYDDQLPPGIFGADAHSLYGASHTDGAVVVVRPDTWVGTATTLDKIADLESYFSGFLVRA